MANRFLLALGLSLLSLTPSFAFDTPWFNRYPDALSLAQRTGRPILIEFAADWSPYSNIFDKEVVESYEFQPYAVEHFILLRLDFPANQDDLPKTLRQQNHAFQQRFKVIDFPTFVILNYREKVEAQWEGYAPRTGPKEFIKLLEPYEKK